jgi:eukaryotic-like serine/threonine-protein kinase
MTDERRIRELLEQILDSHCTPEEACAQCPELLPRLRAQLERLRRFANEIDDLFPSSNPAARDVAARAAWWSAAELPRIDGYDVDSILGHGAMGIVYRARHRQLKRTVALKMLLSGTYASAQELARFVREGEAVARLQHPHIVQIHDVGDVDGRPFLVMEFLSGGTLAEELGGAPQPARRAAEVVAVLADAVQLAHQNGIIHRDLKPSNILLGADGTPKIADFGLARQIDEGPMVTASGARIGTPSYMAPEQAAGKSRTLGPAVDVYALGAILYEMLTGRPPFRADTAVETERQVIDDEPVPPSRLNRNVPRDLETICLKCLNKDPQRRYSAAAELAADVRRFLEGQPIQARRLGWGEKIWRWVRSKPANAALVAMSLALIGLVLGGGLWFARQRTETARRDGRASEAVKNALEKSSVLQQQGRWSEAREALEAAERILGGAAHDELRERLRQARADADMVAELDEIRLRLSEGKTADRVPSVSIEEAYATAFQKYGIDVKSLTPEVAARRIANSAIRLTLLAFLHDWLFRVPEANRSQVRAVLEEADDDGWRRAFREALSTKDAEKLSSLAGAPDAAAQPAIVLSALSGTLITLKYRHEALALLHTALLHHPGDFWINYLLGTIRDGDSAQIGVGFFRAAVALRPRSDQAWDMLGRSLLDAGDAPGATGAFRRSLALDPSGPAALDLPPASTPAGELEQARVIWGKVLERHPPHHDAWHGYAQLCLFLGNEDAYRRARRALLDQFGLTANSWIVGERSSLACLLSPDSDDDLRRTVKLLDLAVADAEKSGAAHGNPYLQFVQGWAEHRQGRYERAIPLLEESAAKLPNRAGPRLVLAMAQFQSGSEIEARKTLATAVRGYNWSESVVMIHAERATAWLCHILRREAERMMLPHLPAFLEGKFQPQDNNDRLAMLGICQFRRLHRASARLYAAAFAKDPGLADELNADCIRRAQAAEAPGDPCETFNTASRFLAARCAALAGCGLGSDADKLADEDRTACRKQARKWLRADLVAWSKVLDGEPSYARDVARKLLVKWPTEPDLAGLREPQALDKMAEHEQRDCRALWQEVRAVIERSAPH